jgi:transglutaminase-like putative cysteine protease
MSTLSFRDAPPARRILTIAVSLAALVGTVLLCVGEGDFTMAVVVGCAVCLSFYLTEWTGLLRLGPLLANLAALVALVVVGFDFFGGDRSMQLIAIANLLVYLQVILLFQEKTFRVYWHLLLLALLQVVVGAALSLSPIFGIVLLAFMVLAAFALHAFFLADESVPLRAAVASAGAWGRSAAKPPASYSSQAHGNSVGRASPRRWSYAGLPMEFAAVSAPPRAKSDGGLRGPIRSTLAALAVALPIAGVIFFAVPRMGSDPWRGGPAEQQRVLGFSQEVRLGELGTIGDNTEVVMRVKFVDPKTGGGIQLTGAPMLRGAVVTRYEQGRWTHHGSSYEDERKALEPPPRGAPFVMQEIALEPLNEPVVFSVYPAYSRRERQPIVYAVDREQLIRQPERLRESQLNLQIDTTGIVDRRQVEITPAERRFNTGRDYRLVLPHRFHDRARSLSTIPSVAERALQDAGAANADTHTICKTLERYLREEGGYTYSLSSPAHTPGLDPVEDFVANNRTGNCEYFASALTLMLRSLEKPIPARVVIGYQRGEWNAVGQFYQFRQLHAHSWVEAYLDRDELAKYVSDVEPYRNGGWLRLDPTPSTSDAQVAEATGVLSSMKQATEFAELVWIKYVVGMTSRRQQETLYRPVQDAFRSLMDPATFVATLGATLRGWIKFVADWLRGNWFSWRGGVAAMIVCLVLAGIYGLVRLIARAVRRLRRGQGAGGSAAGPVVAFYERLERIFAAVGIRRSAEQTQREFAMSVAGHLAESPTTRPHAALPRRIADAFYGVRFGRRTLSAEQEEELTAALAALEAALQGHT